MNKIKDLKIEYFYNHEEDSFENINKFLGKLFKKNGVNLEEIYSNYKIKEKIGLVSGLHRKIKQGDFSDLINNIL